MGRDQEERRKCLEDAIRELFSNWFGLCFQRAANGLTWDALREELATAQRDNIRRHSHVNDYHQLENKEENKDENEVEEKQNEKTLDCIIEQELIEASKQILNDYSCLVQQLCVGEEQQAYEKEVEFFRQANGYGIIEDMRERLQDYFTVTENDFNRLKNKFRDTIMDGNNNYQEKKDDFKECKVQTRIARNRNTGTTHTSYTLIYFTVGIEANTVQKTFWKSSKTKVTVKYMHKRLESRQNLLTFVHKCVTEIAEQKFANAQYN